MQETIEAPQVVPIPESRRDLIEGPYWAALTTIMPDGQPQCTPVWCNLEGGNVLTNTMKGFRKEKNMRENPHVALLVYDPRDPERNIEVRGLVVEMTEDGAVEHDDRLTELYTGKPGAHFFGDAVPAELASKYRPVKVTIAPVHVRAEDSSPSTCPPPLVHTTLRGPEEIPVATPQEPQVTIPDSHGDLLVRPVFGVLSTIMPGGQPQSSLVWVDYDDTHVLISTTLERQKCRNMRADPKVTLLVVDPANTERWIEVRGRVAGITTKGAVAQADKMAQWYTGKQHFYGDIYPVERERQETRVIVKIEPVKVSLDAFFR